MSTRLGLLSLLCSALVLLGSTAYAQQPFAAPATAPAPTAPSTAATTNQAPATPVDPSSHMMAKAIGQMNTNDVDGATASLTEAIRLNPKNSAAYVLRASIYCQRKLWVQAEEDFKTALAIDPNNIVLKFNMVEVKFMQKQYDLARPGYIALEKDPDMGDVAVYKVFLCDLVGGHQAAAQKEFDAINAKGSDASYYFGNAAWYIAHHNIPEARNWLSAAGRIYPPRKNAYYAEGLIYVGYLPLPANAATTPAAQ